MLFLNEVLPEDAFDIVFIFFPDPWPKRKHWKNRLIQKDFPQKIAKHLGKNAKLYISTDYSPYARKILQIMRQAPRFKSIYSYPYFKRERNCEIPATFFENRYLEQKVRPYYQCWLYSS